MKKHILWILPILCVLSAGCGAKPEAAEAKTLTLAVCVLESQMSSSKLLQWVNLYNGQNTAVQIEVVNYAASYDNPFDAISKIKTEIIGGKGPDMIDFGGQFSYSPLDASSGMLADLYPLMQNDETFDRQDYYHNVLDSFAAGGGLYVLVPSYRIASYATTNSALSGLESMDVRQLVGAYDMLDDQSILFPGETRIAVFGMICHGSMENYVDWGESTCSFNGDGFKEILNFAKRFPLWLNITDDYQAKAFFTDGRALLYPVSIDNVCETAVTRTLLGKTPTYIGYPLDAGNGNMAAIDNIAIGINANSRNKEEAWRFLRSLLDSSFQDNIQNGLPLRVSSLEQKLAAAMVTEYGADGEKIVKRRLLFDGDDPVDIYEITAEDAEALRSIINKIEFSSTVDGSLYSIVLEEADYFFNNSRDVDDVADIIQNRASLYINENK